MKKKISQRDKQAKLRKKCDRTAQEIFMTDPKNAKCEICKEPAYCGHHYVPKSLSAFLRYNFKNWVAVCINCHNAHHSKGDPYIHSTIERQRGQEWVEWITVNRRNKVQISLSYYENILKELYSKISTG